MPLTMREIAVPCKFSHVLTVEARSRTIPAAVLAQVIAREGALNLKDGIGCPGAL